MEDETTTEEITDSDYSDSFIASDDDYEDGLTWDSDDSRPPGPSPPASANMSESSPDPPVNVRLNRLRNRPARSLYVEPDTQSDDGSETLSQVSTAATLGVIGNRLSPTVMSHEDESAQDTEMSEDFDETRSSFVPAVQLSNPPSPSQYSPASPQYSPPASLQYPPPTSPQYSPPASPQFNPGSPQNNPGIPQYNPGSPNYPAPPSPDVQIIEPPPPVQQVEDAPQEPPEPEDNPPNAVQPTSEVSKPHLVKASAPDAILNNSTASDLDDNSLCSICMDPLTNSGKHRVVCLRCGHIFGSSCLERWIKVGCNNGAKRCPTCNKKACLKDIRVLYLAKVVPLDTVEKDRLIQEKEELASQKKVMEMELARCKLQNELSTKKYEANILKLEEKLFEAVNAIELLKQGKKIAPLSVDVNKDCVRSKLLHSVDISKDGGCRVLAFNPLLQELIVSQPSGNTIFAGFGVRVLNTVDFMPVRFIFLHQKVIRDLAFHPEDRDLLLSVSLDQTAKLVDLASSTTVHTFKGEGPLWSCCWDVSNPHLMLVGSQQGKVWQYDRRMMDHPCNLWHDQNNLTPVVALAAAPSLPHSAFPQGGFISCRLNAVFAYARFGDTYKRQELPLEGPFMNMRYDYSKQNLLTTSRPSSRCPYVRINLNQVDVNNGNVCLPQIHNFNCGSSARVLSRLTTLPTPNDSLIVAHHESGRTVNIWSSKTGNLETNFPVKEPVIDLTGLTFNNSRCLLATLSDKKVGIYTVT